MSRIVVWFLGMALWFGTPSMSVVHAASKPAARPPGVAAAETISQVTGVAISPLLGVGAAGAFQYFRAPEAERARLSWYAQPWFWGPALLIVGLCFLKDALGPAVPTA